MSRIAIVDEDRCRPSKCRQECKRSCPVNASGKQCIEIADRKSTGSHATEKTVSQIAESLCIGCGICVGKCPFNAITIIKTVSPLPEIVHRYGANSFRLCNLPMPRRSTVLGLLGQNGVGKSTALMILAGKLIPNFGRR
jgi:ATP-binding cassette subfamily E protein 1